MLGSRRHPAKTRQICTATRTVKAVRVERAECLKLTADCVRSMEWLVSNLVSERELDKSGADFGKCIKIHNLLLYEASRRRRACAAGCLRRVKFRDIWDRKVPLFETVEGNLALAQGRK